MFFLFISCFLFSFFEYLFQIHNLKSVYFKLKLKCSSQRTSMNAYIYIYIYIYIYLLAVLFTLSKIFQLCKNPYFREKVAFESVVIATTLYIIFNT
jgi:hypothetical protein